MMIGLLFSLLLACDGKESDSSEESDVSEDTEDAEDADTTEETDTVEDEEDNSSCFPTFDPQQIDVEVTGTKGEVFDFDVDVIFSGDCDLTERGYQVYAEPSLLNKHVVLCESASSGYLDPPDMGHTLHVCFTVEDSFDTAGTSDLYEANVQILLGGKSLGQNQLIVTHSDGA